jgi:pyridoxal phosphate enzyme (YggS family)
MTEKPYSDIRDRALDLMDRVREAALRAGRDPARVQVMAVTKTMGPDQVNAAIEAGVRLLGENRAQELTVRHSSYRLEGSRIHFIGHLQRNKLSGVLPLVQMVESLDSLRLAAAIGEAMTARGGVMDCLLEVNIGRERSKAGFSPEEVWEALPALSAVKGIRVRGLMVIPPPGEISRTEGYFAAARQLFIDIGAKKLDNVHMDFLSMGMSADFESAIRQGSHIVRLGRALFGERTGAAKG